MPTRKRPTDTAEGGQTDHSLLVTLRGMWQFANFCQWVYTFGKAARIDENIDIEDIESDCLTPETNLLCDIALALLKLISSHRGLTHDIFDSQARKQYLDKAPDANPFGNDDAPARFQDFDVPTKIRVLQQLTQWVMIFPERIRERMDEQRDIDQTTWRIEPYGWDSEDRTYFVLDDNRVYRLTEPPPAPPSVSKKRSKKAFRSGRRSSKRRRTQTNAELDAELDEMSEQEQPQKEYDSAKAPEDGLGGMVWECLAVTLEEARLLIDGFRKSRDENEKILRKQLEQHLLPILEKQEESRQRRIAQRERELLTMAKLANAKRSSRLASKLEQQKHEEKVREEQQQQQQAALTRLREEEACLKRETERDFRMASRGQRLREREARRIQHEAELANLSEDSKCQENGQSRLSERRRQAEIERAQQALKDLDDEDDEWIFDCVCGLYGKVDDGTHSVACESCNVWQHSRCLGLSEDEVESPESHFVCAACKRRQVEARNAKPHTTIKLKVKRDQNTSNTQQHVVDDPRNNDTGDSTQSVGSSGTRPPSPQKHNVEEVHGTASTSLPGMTQTDLESNGAIRLRENDTGIKDHIIPAQQVHSPSAMYPERTPGGIATPSAGMHPVSESKLNTPAISREIYRATHDQNGNIPASGGLSPTKQSPHNSFTSNGTVHSGTTPIRIPPGITLSPTPQKTIMTPPTKHQELSRPNSQQ